MQDQGFNVFVEARYGGPNSTSARYLSDAKGLDDEFRITSKTIQELDNFRDDIYQNAVREGDFWTLTRGENIHRIDHNHRSVLKLYIEFRRELADENFGQISLRQARALIQRRHVKEASRLVRAEGLAWLYERTARHQPKHRYVVVDGERYPTKAFGFLVAQLAAGNTRATNDMTVEEAYAPLKRLGYPEVAGMVDDSDAKISEAVRTSYYVALGRPRQAEFRRLLLQAYGGACALSGVATPESLEAAHVVPFQSGDDTLSNGLLLRADLHRLFDSGHLAFDPKTLKASFSNRSKADYAELDGRRLKLPPGGPVHKLFGRRWGDFARARTKTNVSLSDL